MLFAGCRGCGSKAYEPGRIDVVDGVLVASVERTTAPEPKVAPLLSLDFDRLVHALELDSKARATWLAALEADAAAGVSEAALQTKYGPPLEACFSSIFGGCGTTQATPAFDAWLASALVQTRSTAVRAVLERGKRERPHTPADDVEVLPARTVDLRERLAEEFPPFSDAVVALVGREPGLKGEIVELIHAELVQRVATQDDFGFRLHETLARLDLEPRSRDRAPRQPVARPAHARDPRPQLLQQAKTLARFGSIAEMDGYLDGLGLPHGTPLPTPEPPLSLVPRLLARGNAIAFDAETGHVPVDHATVVRWLVDLLPELAGAEVDEAVPPEEERHARGRLWLQLGTERFGVETRPSGDFRDADACLGLVNAVLVEKKSANRVVVLEPGDQFVTVLVAPLKTAQALKHDGLLAYGDELGGRRANAP